MNLVILWAWKGHIFCIVKREILTCPQSLNRFQGFSTNKRWSVWVRVSVQALKSWDLSTDFLKKHARWRCSRLAKTYQKHRLSGCCCCFSDYCSFPVALGAKCPLNRAGLMPVLPFLSEYLILSLLIVNGCVVKRISTQDLAPGESSVWSSSVSKRQRRCWGDGGLSTWPACQDGHKGQRSAILHKVTNKGGCKPRASAPVITHSLHPCSSGRVSVVIDDGPLDFPCFGSQQVFQWTFYLGDE